jgi:peptidoglycan/xylan/chitin deacetylase (PgdA/CDA1 family)
MKTVLSDALGLFLGPAVGPIRTPEELAGLESVGPPPAFLFSPSDKLTRILARRGYTRVRQFAAIPSGTMPRWLLPIGSINATLAGTQIYMPHKWLAKAGMNLLKGAIRAGGSTWLGSNVVVASKGSLGLETLVGDVTGEKNPVFALSIGRRLAVRKLTIQVMRPNGEILGYMKLPFADAARERVRHEATVLEQLWNFPTLRPHIPRLLHAGVWNDTYLLFQSPLAGQLGPADLSPAHKDFLQMLWRISLTERPGQSLVEEIGRKWDKAVVVLGSNWKDLGQEVLRGSAQDLDGLTVRCGISHGDFAPWNIRVHEGRLRLFDWESTQWAAPILWDVYHFALQTAVSFRKAFVPDLPSGRDAKIAYRLYLLNSVIQFVEEGNLSAIEHRRRLLANELERSITVRTVDRVSTKRGRGGIDRQPRKLTRVSKVCTDSVPRIVTTSWDDGDPHDVRVAELLHSRGMAGTFYIPIMGYLNKTTLRGSDLREFSSKGFEIGAHSVSHKSLTLIDGKEMQGEVKNCKRSLEETVGKEVAMFCYPNGRYNARVIEEVRRAGYKGARTTWMLSTGPCFPAFEMPTTLQAFPHPAMGYVRDLGRARNFAGLWRFSTELRRAPRWIDLGKKLFSEVLKYGGIWHLYGHSWEIEDLEMWDQLREMLDHVSRREGVLYLTNGQSISRLSETNFANGNAHLKSNNENPWSFQEQEASR